MDGERESLPFLRRPARVTTWQTHIRRAARSLRGHAKTLVAEASIASLLLVALAVGAVVGFVQVTEVVLGGASQDLDLAALEWFHDQRRPGLTSLAGQITALGNAATLAVVTLAAAAILWAGGRRVSVYLLLLSVVTGTIMTFALKAVFDRPRPEVPYATGEPLSASFPSGHALMSAVTYLTVAYLVGRMAHKGPVRHATWAVAGLLVVLIGLSRMYVGVHYPTDVAAGWLGGVAWTILLAGAFRVLGVFAQEMPEIREQEEDIEDAAPA